MEGWRDGGGGGGYFDSWLQNQSILLVLGYYSVVREKL